MKINKQYLYLSSILNELYFNDLLTFDEWQMYIKELREANNLLNV